MGTVTYFMKIYLTMEKYIGDKIGDCPYFPQLCKVRCEELDYLFTHPPAEQVEGEYNDEKSYQGC